MDGRIDCTRCRHFVVTWRPGTPRGCRLYGFEGMRPPSAVVREATGAPCGGYDPRPPADLPGRRAAEAPPVR